MKWLVLLSVLWIGAIASGDAMAAAASTCSSLGNRLTASEITSRFQNQLVCAQKMGAITGNDRWAEEHRSSAELWEQGKGTTSKVHPPTKVGAWKSVEGTKVKGKSGNDDVVRYDYSGGSTFNRSVFEKNVAGTKTYTFCTSDEQTVIATATLKTPNPSSTNACGF